MKKSNKIRKETTDSRTYKMANLFYHFTYDNRCAYCAPHKGCNYSRKKQIRNWKQFRKKQWKSK